MTSSILEVITFVKNNKYIRIWEELYMYTASKERYTAMEYNRCGNSGLMLPKVSLGLWHNFGDTANFENMRKLCFTAFDSGKISDVF